MLKRLVLSLMLVLLMALPAPALADFAQDKRRCHSERNLDLKIGACTRLIQSGRLGNRPPPGGQNSGNMLRLINIRGHCEK